MKHLLVASSVVLALGACKSVPEPVEDVPVVEAPVAAPEPVFIPAEPAPAPAPLPPVVEAPKLDLPPPGSIEDFNYQAGGDRVFFGYDQNTLSPEARETLAKQAEWLQLYPNVQAVIEGHADERGTREYNLALGARRAEAVKDYLVSRGVAANRLRTVSYGKERPIDGRSNAEGWARNRNGYTNIVAGAVS